MGDPKQERLFEGMRAALEQFLQDEAPLYQLAQVGVMHNFNEDEIVLKLHIRQSGSARVIAGPMIAPSTPNKE